MDNHRLVIVGGGIAGLSCLEGILADLSGSANGSRIYSITLVSDSRLIKRAREIEFRGRQLESFVVLEENVDDLIGSIVSPACVSLKSIVGHVDLIDPDSKNISITDISDPRNNLYQVDYDLLCLCCGSRPKELDFPSRQVYHELAERIFILKDTTTIRSLQSGLIDCQHLAIVGNGGISLELIHKISNCRKTWIIKDEYIGSDYFDSGASKFLIDNGLSSDSAEQPYPALSSEIYRVSKNKNEEGDSSSCGPSLGPYWSEGVSLSGQCDNQDLNIIYKDEVSDITYDRNASLSPVVITTMAGRIVKCDMIALAIGVAPRRLQVVGDYFKFDEQDRGILIDDRMRTSIPGIFAAGDLVSCRDWPKNNLWFQKRLWTQARQMGFYAGRCMVAELHGLDPCLYFNFDCFTHCTSFFGKKLILLGRYNGQQLTDEEAKTCEVIARVIKSKEYTKLLLKNGRIIGAVLIGDSGLEETIENLIHDQIDVSQYKDRLLDGSVDIEDFFD